MLWQRKPKIHDRSSKLQKLHCNWRAICARFACRSGCVVHGGVNFWCGAACASGATRAPSSCFSLCAERFVFLPWSSFHVRLNLRETRFLVRFVLSKPTETNDRIGTLKTCLTKFISIDLQEKPIRGTEAILARANDPWVAVFSSYCTCTKQTDGHTHTHTHTHIHPRNPRVN
jgi:hypothetical protein